MEYLDDEIFKFKSGRTFYSNKYLIGISPWLDITEGYDGSIAVDDFTREEKIELADYMIGLWTRFKEGARRVPPK